MVVMRAFVLLSFFSLCLSMADCRAQSSVQARAYIDTLCAPGMYGRGAEFSGDSLAAVFLRDRFREFGLTPFQKAADYFQYFHYNINTFPGRCALRTNIRKLKPGASYIVNSFSAGGKGRAKIVPLDTNIFARKEAAEAFLKSDLRKKALVYYGKDLGRLVEMPLEYIRKAYSARCIVELEEKKLTAGLSTSQYSNPFFKVLADSFPAGSKRVVYRVDAELREGYKSRNILAYVEGREDPDTYIVFTAHYDHLGGMGREVYFPGANDNASGVAMLLQLAEYYSHPDNQPDYSIAFMLFGAEEAGLVGSKHYVRHPVFPLKKIRFLINMDLLGTGEDGLMVVNGEVLPEYFSKLSRINGEAGLLKEIRKRGEAANSDHYFFSEAGVPAFFVYTLGGIAAYHDIYDVPATLPLTEFEDVFRLLTRFVYEIDQ